MFGIPRRTLSIAVLAASLVVFIQAVVGLDADRRRGLLIQLNEHLFNPLAMRTAAYRRTYYGVVHHVGRRSGRTYDAPVVVKFTTRGVLIPLPYGANTDWCRNVLAAGGCAVTFRGQELTLRSPDIIPASVAEPLVPPINAMFWRRVGIRHYLLLRVVEQSGAAAETDPIRARATP